MAYRVKGFLTQAERNCLVGYIRNYLILVSNDSLGEHLREMVRAVFCPWFILARFALYVDDCKIIDKIIHADKKA